MFACTKHTLVLFTLHTAVAVRTPDGTLCDSSNTATKEDSLGKLSENHEIC